MLNINKKFILLLSFILILGILSGCNGKKIEFEGVKNKTLTKDLIELRELAMDSIKDKEYKEDDISKVIDKINDVNYQEKLSDVEILLIKNINETKEDLKYDLNNGKKIITSSTYEKINWLLQATTENP